MEANVTLEFKLSMYMISEILDFLPITHRINLRLTSKRFRQAVSLNFRFNIRNSKDKLMQMDKAINDIRKESNNDEYDKYKEDEKNHLLAISDQASKSQTDGVFLKTYKDLFSLIKPFYKIGRASCRERV